MDSVQIVENFNYVKDMLPIISIYSAVTFFNGRKLAKNERENIFRDNFYSEEKLESKLTSLQKVAIGGLSIAAGAATYNYSGGDLFLSAFTTALPPLMYQIGRNGRKFKNRMDYLIDP